MKIVHICLCGTFADDWGYQENILSKYHKKMGNEVTVITSQYTLNDCGKPKKIEISNYYNDDGVKIIRLHLKKKYKITDRFKRYENIVSSIENEYPDVLFIHGCQFLDIRLIAKFVSENNTIVYIDNHADFSNSATNIISKYLLHGIIWRLCSKKIEPFVTYYYGVLPARVDFLQNIYHTPKDRTRLLVMGGDDEYVTRSLNKRDELQKKYDCKNKFVITTGGKIDRSKKDTLYLMEAFNKLKLVNVKLFIFGSVSSDLKDEFENLLSINNNIVYLNWLNNIEIYDLIAITNLGFFPGRHSVIWEQFASMGVPMVCRYWEGTTHIDSGGNILFINDTSVEGIYDSLKLILGEKQKYNKLKKKAESNAYRFLYSNIAIESLKNKKGKSYE